MKCAADSIEFEYLDRYSQYCNKKDRALSWGTLGVKRPVTAVCGSFRVEFDHSTVCATFVAPANSTAGLN